MNKPARTDAVNWFELCVTDSKEHAKFTEWIKATDHRIETNGLQPAANASPLRARNRKVLVRDGPFAETKEQLGGSCLFDAMNRKNAVPASSKIPTARLAGVRRRRSGINREKKSI